MKKQTIISILYLSTLPILAFGQQPKVEQTRVTDPIQLLETKRGELELFKTLVYRFEVAWQESDLQSMVDLQDGLHKLMGTEIKQFSEKANPSKAESDRLKSAMACSKQHESQRLSSTIGDFGKKAEEIKLTLHAFIKLMEADFDAQSKAMRQQEKQ